MTTYFSTRTRIAIISTALTFASVLALPASGQGTDTASLTLDTVSITKANRITTPDLKASLRVDSNTLTTPGEVSLSIQQIETTPLPVTVQQISESWVIDLHQSAAVTTLPKAVTLVLPYTNKGYGSHAAFIGLGTSWRRLWSQDDRAAQRLTIRTSMPYGQIVVVEYTKQFEGIASWYGSKVQFGAAMNIVPLGTRVKVTNLINKKSVVVKIVSRGPYVAGRVIDLTGSAFSVIASKSTGVARVRVEMVDATALVTPAVPTQKPVVTSPTALILNPLDQSVVFEKGSGVQRPLASITKLMTALVFFDSKPDLTAIVAMAANDMPSPEHGAIISVAAGQTLSVKDLVYSTITGSANNAALALQRLSGLSRESFVAAMNAKALALGMTNTHFEDPTGLSEHDISTAMDIALLAQAAFAIPSVRDAGLKHSYTFTVRSNSIKHTVRHPLYIYNKLLNTAPIAAAKTGFINEAGQCVVFLGNGATGKEYVGIVLGATSARTRAYDVNAMMGWAALQF